MKCSIMLHFIWVFTVCQSTHFGVSHIYIYKGLTPSATVVVSVDNSLDPVEARQNIGSDLDPNYLML